MEHREPDAAAPSVDEPARDERRKAELVRATLRVEAAVHDRERALGVGARDASREREVRAEPVVAAPGCRSRSGRARTARRAAARAWSPTSTRTSSSARPVHRRSSPIARRGEVVAALDEQPRPNGSGLERRDSHAHRTVDDEVIVGRRVVVGVAAVTAVDETVEAGDLDAVVRAEREGPGGRVDGDARDARWRAFRHRHVDRVAGPSPAAAVYVRHPKPATSSARRQHLTGGRRGPGGSGSSRRPRRAPAALRASLRGR